VPPTSTSGSADSPEVLVVNYGDPASLRVLIASVSRQTLAPSRTRIWHNGPSFPPPPIDGAEVYASGENLGFGEGINRLLEHVEGDHVVIANPDLELDERCIELLAAELRDHPEAAVAAAALVTPGPDPRVNAYGQRLTSDYLGVLPDRGMPWASFLASARNQVAAAPSRYVGPSGALFALNVRLWERLGGGPLFPRSFFLYMEDVALWIRLRLRGAEICFCPAAWATHSWSAATGQRSPAKLFHVERNRLWLVRALRGRPLATLLLFRTVLRYAAYLRSHRDGVAAAHGSAAMLAKAIWDGLLTEVPQDVRDYFRGCDVSQLPRTVFATWTEELTSPFA
jgi:N-acetylglucosaminyl-diphospho-decaprenol L-rhamnosyltransferase